MKSLKPWILLLATASSQAVFAQDGVMDYRDGDYFAAAKAFQGQEGQNALVDYYIAQMRLYGYGMLKNNHMAMQAFIRSAEKGYLPAQKFLARYYLIKADNPEKAFHWFQKAAASEVMAQLYVTGAYLHGYGTRKNPDAARRYFIEAAKSGNALAQYTLAEHFLDTRYRNNRKLGVIWLEKSAAQNNPKALLKLGQMYLDGDNVKKDPFKGTELLEQAAKLNYMPATLALADYTIKQGNYVLAQSLLENEASGKNTQAQFLMAQLYLNKNNPAHDASKGFKWMLLAAQHGNADAQDALAQLYKDGTGVQADEKLAAQWQEKAKVTRQKEDKIKLRTVMARWLSNDKSDSFADSGYRLKGISTDWHNPDALKQNNYNQPPRLDVVTKNTIYKPKFNYVDPKQIPISEYFDVLAMSLDGNRSDDWSYKHYPINPQIISLKDSESLVMQHPQFEEWTVSSGLLPYPNANELDLSRYFETRFMPSLRQLNYQSVLGKMYNKAILGETNSQFEIGQLYHYGIGVAKNPEQAKIYYELSAGQGDERSEYNLAILYLDNQLKPANYKKGIEWLTDAAFKGNPYAQYTLANIKEKGLTDPEGKLVVAPDHEQAMAMYYLASSNHFGAAQDRLADFLVRSNDKQLDVAARKKRANLIKKLYRGAAENGVADAQLPLAFYDAMEQDPQKQKQAYEVALREANRGNTGAALLVAMMLERGLAVPADQEKAIAYYQKSALNPVSEFVLGTYYANGTGVSKDLDKARALLEQSAMSGFAYGNFNLAILNQKTGQPFLGELDKARLKNNSTAGLLMADYFLKQANSPQDMQKARDIYNDFAQKGDKLAQVKLAYLYDEGLGGEHNAEIAEKWYRASATQGYPLAQYLLGRFYQQGSLGAPNYVWAMKWFNASKKQFSPSAVASGFVADTVMADYKQAAASYQLAAEQGDINGHYNLALIYDYGKGQAMDGKKAEQYYLYAANKGLRPAMTQLAGLYFKGIDGQRDESEALKWYEKAASRGDRNANYMLGLFAETGIVTKVDLAKAQSYYQKASEAGNDKATLALARMYQYGLGVNKDIEHAATLYRQLAQQNNPYAQYKLGKLYYEGALGEKKTDEGKRLLSQASRNGNEEAKKMLQFMQAQQASRLSMIEPVTIARAADFAGQPAEEIYMDALNEWNRGEERQTRAILSHLIQSHPDFAPARQAYDSLKELSIPGRQTMAF